MKHIKLRLQSHVVQIQIISIAVGVIIFFAPQLAESVKVVSGAIIAMINIFAGLNNPLDKENY